MSKKRKRDQETEKSATTSLQISRAPAPEKTKKKDRKDKEKKKDRKEKKRQLEEESNIDEEEGSRSPEALNFASLANAEDKDETNNESSDGSEDGDKATNGGEDVMDVDDNSAGEYGDKSEKAMTKKSKKNDLSTGHRSILSKFDKYRAENPKSKDTEIEEEDVEAEPLHGLEGIPLPPSVPQPKVDPNSALPSYLAHPTSVSTASTPAFSSFNLPTHVLTRLEKLSLTHTFPIQSALLPLLLPPLPTEPYIYKPHRDLLVSAPTGSGKTLSYLLPIISSLLSRVIPKTRALIIVPTHELASQVQKTAQSLASGTNLKICTAVGTRSFDSEKEMIVLNETATTGADILIATPGRLVEHIRRNDKFTLRWLQWLVIDEADRLLAQSFQDWLGAVTVELEKPFEDREEPFDVWFLGLKKDRCPADVVKKVVLSATMTRDVGKLAGLKLRRPQLIVADSEGGREVGITTGEDGAMEVDEDAGAQTTSKEKKAPKELTSLPAGLEEVYYPIFNISQKPLLLSKLLSISEITSGILIFTKSNESAARLGRLLELLAAPKSKSKSKKSKAIKWRIAVSTSDIRKRDIAANTTKFKKSEIDILISTDLMSRGVDLPNAQLVINYDSPRSERDYIHRVGRTARAGNSGVAWSLVEDGEKRWWWGCIGKVKRGQEVKKEVPPAVSEEEVERYEACLETLGKEVRGE